jgi:hypothetical protein
MAKTSVQVTGVKESLKTLRKTKPEIRRQFNKDARKIVKPIVDEAKQAYPAYIMSGLSRAWQQNGRQIFPYDQTAAQRNIKVKISTAKKATSVIAVVQQDVAAAVLETAGKRNPNTFSSNLSNAWRDPMRAMWPAAEDKLPDAQREMVDAIDKVEARINAELRR